MLSVTGERPKNHKHPVGAEIAPIVCRCELENTKSHINQSMYSGKKFGTIVIGQSPKPQDTSSKKKTTYGLFMAMGSQPTDPWVPMHGALLQSQSPVEMIDVVNFTIEKPSVEGVKFNHKTDKTVCVQTPMYDITDAIIYREEFTANFELEIPEGVPDNISFEINIEATHTESQYYAVDTAYVSVCSAEVPADMKDYQFIVANVDAHDAQTNAIKVFLHRGAARKILVSFRAEWISPESLLR